MDSLISKLFNFWELIEQEARNKRAFPMHLMSAPYWLPSRMEQNVTAVYMGQPSGNLKIKRPCLGDHWRKNRLHDLLVAATAGTQLYGLPREEDSERGLNTEPSKEGTSRPGVRLHLS